MWDGGSVISEGGVVDLVDKDAEESGSLLARVRLELRLDVENECRGDSGEQTSLCLGQHMRTEVSYRTHEDEGRVQIFIVLLHELLIVLLGLFTIVLKELCPVVLLNGCRIYFFPTASFSVIFWSSANENSPIHLLSTVLFPALIFFSCPFRALTVIEDRKWEIGQM